MAKEKSIEKVVFYISRLNGEQHLKETPIHYPYLSWEKGRTKEEDTPDESFNVSFVRGRLELDADDWRVQWMRVYNDGGRITVDGKERPIQPNRNMFIISEKDPSLNTTVVERKVVEVKELKVISTEFANMLQPDQLEQFAVEAGVDIGGLNTKQELIDKLIGTGNIK